MSSQLTVDCLNRIFKCLEEDKVNLHSCLLVNRFWCRASVEILWKNIWIFKFVDSSPHDLDVSLKVFETLVAFLPNESIDFLFENGISIPTTNQRSPLFNYVSFIKVLSIPHLIIGNVSYNKILTGNSKTNYLISHEILRMFMNHASLKKLAYCLIEDSRDNNVSDYFKLISNFISFPGAKDCLNNLSDLRCGSDISSEFFQQLSQICHNIQSLRVHFCCISKELNELFLSQKNLISVSFIKYGDYYYGDYFHNIGDDKDVDDGDDDDDDDDDYNDDDDDNDDDEVYVYSYSIRLNNNDDDDDDYDDDDDDDEDHKIHHNDQDWPKIASLLAKHSNTIKNLLLEYRHADFKEIQYITFPHLRILKLVICPEVNMLIKFLENNGRNLEELYVNRNDNSLHLAITEFCPNLKSLHTIFPRNEIEMLKLIFESCQQLESFLGICGHCFLGGKKLLEAVAKYSPESFRELKFHSHVTLGSNDLRSFFIGWKARKPQNPISLIISEEYFKLDIKTGEMIARYKKLEVFKTRKEYTDCYPRLYGFQTNQQPHFSRIYQFCLPTPIINITQPHDLWIDRWIPDSILKDQLPSASSNLAHRHTLQFYTDETHSNTQIGACIQDWPSTRAELMGIFLALLVSPPNSIIHIYTDSQSAIHSINNVLQHKNARRLDLDSSYDNRFTHGSNEFRFMPQYNRTSIEQNIRKFIHKALHFRNYGAWSRLKSNIDCFVDKRFDYDWHTTWTTIKQIKFFKCASTKRNSLWSFIIKALHKELPIATRLKQQKPALYSDLKYQFCHKHEETNHLSTCTQTTDQNSF
ncbi:hypothetical protein RhiirA5_498169 [Rhizophagus irregularis]|uniref:F-box domain-containing protein n=1 Tax=Rhizophagus irregularis TaxID=588596 RepID=A0A2N0PVN9_9GLOM|nr:hypothetical protein RhiirA5_498169 [Rhizophagus irregularis]